MAVATATRREQNKADKRDRILLAAHRLFAENGYDETAVRDVAREAGVALGTISLYAADKRDLSVMVFNAHMSKLLRKATTAELVLENAGLHQRMLAFFSTYYHAFHRDQTLARVLLQLNYYSSGMHGEEYFLLRVKTLRTITDIVNRDRALSGRKSAHADEFVAQHFFMVFSSALRWWIAEKDPDLQQGLAALDAHFRLVREGL